jgi:hypothetical protein
MKFAMEAAGIEPGDEIDPTTDPHDPSVTSLPHCAANALQLRRTGCLRLASIDTDLLNVVSTWSRLSPNIRAAIVTLVSAAQLLE